MRYHIRAKPVRTPAVRSPATIITVLAAALAALNGCTAWEYNGATQQYEWSDRTPGGCTMQASRKSLDALSRRGTTGSGDRGAGDNGSRGGARAGGY